MRVLVDGDSCFRKVRDFLIESAIKKRIDLLIAADDSSKLLSEELPFAVLIEPGKDSVDNYLLNIGKADDVLITRDLLFAKEALSKGMDVMNDRGVILDKSKLSKMIQQRDISMALMAGGHNRAIKKKIGINRDEFENFKKTIYIFIENKEKV
ncbi:MAG: DUF188 domain-containing protein [Spirochaetaceae bacterium]|nr:DUF188 domain-containing protein [Spirochaetaceae bacterium]